MVLVAVILQTQRYLGLSLPLLQDAFNGSAQFYDFLGKLGFTVLSLGAGYQGGEVTPLFEIGGNFRCDISTHSSCISTFFSRIRVYWGVL